MRFFETAFGLSQRFYHESGYGEKGTGQTALAFASHEVVKFNLPGGYTPADTSTHPLGMEIALITDDVHAAYIKAVNASAKSLKEPMVKPLGANRILSALSRWNMS